MLDLDELRSLGEKWEAERSARAAMKQGYRRDWPLVARKAKQKAGWCCERCGHPHDPRHGHMLAVHHLDGDKHNCDPANLAPLCQRCHLHVQAKFDPRQTILQLPMFDEYVEEPWMAERRRRYREVFGRRDRDHN